MIHAKEVQLRMELATLLKNVTKGGVLQLEPVLMVMEFVAQYLWIVERHQLKI
jgi:hypothetical protein